VDSRRRLPLATLATIAAVIVVPGVLGLATREPAGTSQVLAGPAGPTTTALAAEAAGDGPQAATATVLDAEVPLPPRPWRRRVGEAASIPPPRVADERGMRGADELAPTSTSPEGYTVLGGRSQAGDGPTVMFTVEVEPATGIAPAEALAVAEKALFDPRSWARDAHLVRVETPTQAAIRLLFATPSTVDRLCAEAGLETHGVYSCWNGRFAAINSWRYAFGATGFDDDNELYRRYVVNHEFGHGLGHGHVLCPAAGAVAPVMVQQSASLGGCVANGWPYPD
jgi:hypothetical protein